MRILFQIGKASRQWRTKELHQFDKITVRILTVQILTEHCAIGSFTDRLDLRRKRNRYNTFNPSALHFSLVLGDRTFEDLCKVANVPLRKPASFIRSSEYFKPTTNGSEGG